MIKAEADNSYLDLDYSGLKKKLLLIISWNFIKTVSRKTIKISLCFKNVLYYDNILLHCYM